jgi:SAM-dependent methyltransferase/glycosyltransferase involved in cell wall biosynthesis
MAPEAADLFAPLDPAYSGLTATAPDAPPTVAVIVDSRRPGTAAAWRSVLAHTRNASILVIDDATSDSWSTAISSQDGVQLVRHEQPRGHRGCAAEAAARTGHGDLVLLDGDVEVGPAWLDGLRRVAAGSAGVGLVAADVLGRAADFPGCGHLGAAEIARAVSRTSGPVTVEVNEVRRGAVLLTRTALNAWQSAGEPALALGQVARVTAMRGLRTMVAVRVVALRTEDTSLPRPSVSGRVGLPDYTSLGAALRVESTVLPRRLYLSGPSAAAAESLRRLAAGLTHVQESYLLQIAADGATMTRIDARGTAIVGRHPGAPDPAGLLALLVNLDVELVHVDNAAPAAGLLLELAGRLGVPRVAAISTVPVDPQARAELLIAPGPAAAAATTDARARVLDPGTEVPGARALRQRRARRGGPTRVLAWPADAPRVVERLRALAERTGPAVEFHTLGAGDLDLGDLLVGHDAGDAGAMHRVLNEIDPDLGLVLDDPAEARSTAARSWWALGVPLLVLGEGEAAGRVREIGAGLAVPGDDLDTAAAALHELALHPDQVQRMRTEVPRRAVVPTTVAVERHRACYTEVTHRPAHRPRVGYVMRGEQGRHESCEQIRILARLAQLEPGAAVVRQVLPAEARDRDVLRGLDVLLVQQRMLGADAEPVLAAVRATGTRLVVDIDDDLIDPEAQPRSNLDARDFMRMGVELATRLRSADTVLVSTEPLAERLGPLCGARCVLVPNHLNPRIWTTAVQTRKAPRHQGFRLLYMGTRTHLEDLLLLAPVLDKVAANLGRPVTLEVVGVADEFDGDEWITRLRIPRDSRHYPQFVAWLRSHKGRWDAAVAPLVNSRFNHAKSDLKLLEYALMDLPVVASDVGPYRGAGHLARLTDNDPPAWVTALSEILGDPVTTRLRAEAAREFVLSRRMITVQHGRDWLAAVVGGAAPVEHDGSATDGALVSGAAGADAVRYADGAEDDVLARLRAAVDVSAGCDELAAHAGDSWELAYHFSPQRLGLLAPLRLHAGMRIADLGCGSGVLSRAMGESGASVLGVEGVRSRAAAARVRCADLPNVQIVDGRAEEGIAEVRDLDLVLVCGLLEYTAKEDPAGPARLLRAAAAALAPDGVLVVAIENQLGLGYLVGRHEDHHDTPWVGMADYPLERRGPRTWTTRRLTAMFAEQGLTATRWFAPYPDYKLPRVVLDAEVFKVPDAVDVVDKLVRFPLNGAFRGSEAVVSGRRFQQVLIEEGMGLSTAPCFMVVAARTTEAIGAHTEDGLAWMINNSRLSTFRRTRALGRDLQLRTRGGAHTHTTDWLTQRLDALAPLIPGRPMDALLLDALHDGNEAELHRLLRRWHDAAAVGQSVVPVDAEPHPFLPRPGVPMWQPDRLDAHPGNWILTADDELVAVDDEWRARTGVDAELAALRALLLFAGEVVTSGSAHPWGAGVTSRQIFTKLADPLGLMEAAAARWDELIAAEARLQHVVTGVDIDGWIALIGSRVDTPARRWLWDTTGGLAIVETSLAEAFAQTETLRGQIVFERRAARRAQRRLAQTESTLTSTRVKMRRAEKRLASSRTKVARLEASAPVRLGKALRTPTRTLRALRRRAGRLRRRASALRRRFGAG